MSDVSAAAPGRSNIFFAVGFPNPMEAIALDKDKKRTKEMPQLQAAADGKRRGGILTETDFTSKSRESFFRKKQKVALMCAYDPLLRRMQATADQSGFTYPQRAKFRELNSIRIFNINQRFNG